MTDGQRRAFNNDGMDPDWRPSLSEPKAGVIEKLQALINSCQPFGVAVNQMSEEELLDAVSKGRFISITISAQKVLDLKRALEELEK